MESLGLSEFLKSVGNSVHSLNTICVGLHGVETRIYTKPDDLTVTWDPQDPCWSARKSRTFAINAAIVFVEEALMQYVRYLAKHPAAPETLKQTTKIEGGAERLEHICTLHTPEKEYWGPFASLLVHWRNRIVHPASNAKLSAKQESSIIEHAEDIKNSHAKIDVKETLKHFHDRSITLKDASTLIAITIRFARGIDKSLQLDTAAYEKIPYWLKHLNLEDQYRSICKSNGTEERERRVRQFFKTHLPFINEELTNQVIEKPLTI
ncbi:hypothetical protein [Comamonas aquatica]|uniref:hypothetical protein n=1 Tax=Comamonas aquatica TaxID=225991 RepID=UPI001B370325|nr:hypothetical protein [Comamonas aquatica]QTX20365.1 hypothetical protein KAQ61_15285 [Comamonas aquatica]